MTARQPDVILFDLGGVLVELGGVATMLGWMEHTAGAGDLWQRWLRSPAVRRFERGQGTAEEFAQAVVDEFALAVTAEEFLAAFTVWPTGLYPGVLPLLTWLRASYTLASFSNNNSVHWDRIYTDMGLGTYFTHHFPSHLTGRLKPDREAFEYVLAALGCAPEQVLFLDDNMLNVAAARDTGIVAKRTEGFGAVLDALEEQGIAVPAHLHP